MTTKDYQLVAHAIKGAATLYEHGASSDRDARMQMLAVREVALRFCDEAKQDNPRFDQAIFLASCGMEA